MIVNPGGIKNYGPMAKLNGEFLDIIYKCNYLGVIIDNDLQTFKSFMKDEFNRMHMMIPKPTIIIHIICHLLSYK